MIKTYIVKDKKSGKSVETTVTIPNTIAELKALAGVDDEGILTLAFKQWLYHIHFSAIRATLSDKVSKTSQRKAIALEIQTAANEGDIERVLELSKKLATL